ncbi:hypothetical protein E3N88_14445 [Mikania micrantha]|uniref:BURP domain-containing protein n=1 Tax=Mikania micrantha TaxID=192012 RepID=A0A5N6P4I6_9ASTR|nr:hypothetical protein E3N88_14445 [Mikania micrantha]
MALVGSQALNPEVYWNSVLPKTPMPTAIKELLYTKAWNDGMEEVARNAASRFIKLNGQPEQSYSYAPKEEAKKILLAQLLFLENDLHQGKEKVLQLSINDQKTPFLPKAIADSIPFSSNDLSKIYNMFSIKPDSTEAEIMKQTLFFCDKYEAIDGEEKFCATSLESMIDFATTKLGKKVKALSTKKTKENKISQKYKVGLIKKLGANEGVVCHRQMYPYAIFYCHKIEGTESYVVSLESANGAKVKSMAVCHTDTSKMNPKHPAFQVLKVAPGTAAICHFLLEDEVLWVPY